MLVARTPLTTKHQRKRSRIRPRFAGGLPFDMTRKSNATVLGIV